MNNTFRYKLWITIGKWLGVYGYHNHEVLKNTLDVYNSLKSAFTPELIEKLEKSYKDNPEKWKSK